MAESQPVGDAAARTVPAVGTAPAKAPFQLPAATVEDDEDFPDPDEDDLDDLDDLLDDFSAAKIEHKTPAVPPPPGRPAEPMVDDDLVPSLQDMLQDDDFTKQLQAGMAGLLGEIQTSPEMQAQLDSLFKELGEAAAGSGEDDVAAAAAAAAVPAPSEKTVPAAAVTEAAIVGAGVATAAATKSKTKAKAKAAPTASEASFQETIRRTMERMQASGEQATAAATADTNSADDLLTEFMKQMQSGGLGSGANEDELSKMLVGMMEELTNREILYEPMKELSDKFPAWLEQNRAATAPADLKRYEEQQAIVRDIVARFELPTYSDTNPADREYIVDRMQKMQAAGSPPPDLVGDMPGAQDPLAPPDESCNPQ
ncbi:peroxisomal membrane protein receptor [Grosmannia clavigera kw1407]|uniref:Peroxisomal membrane protein receptor n=1 Tax=Grosmannia clavigera (strain kw1407 / UAMH 11150) TaxID=655863 RepID=F0XFS7_GROCL|nr:peroxisomal membrane protein receptor [Grosmannia clavigera kw1407]EFX04462.1 peroxisomal membrane protein receptor [Grosmannia clavigera kw1407]